MKTLIFQFFNDLFKSDLKYLFFRDKNSRINYLRKKINLFLIVLKIFTYFCFNKKKKEGELKLSLILVLCYIINLLFVFA